MQPALTLALVALGLATLALAVGAAGIVRGPVNFALVAVLLLGGAAATVTAVLGLARSARQRDWRHVAAYVLVLALVALLAYAVYDLVLCEASWECSRSRYR